MSFLELYQQIQESKDEFCVGDIRVRLVAVSETTFETFAEAANTIPNPRSLGEPNPHPFQMMKWRATYTIAGRPVTNYLTAMDKREARRMLYDYLSQFLKHRDDQVAVAKNSELVPVNSWEEMVRLVQYSMKHTNKSFDAIDNGDIAWLLEFIQKHPDFVQSHLATLDEKTRFYIKRLYNHATKRDLDSAVANNNYWGDRAKSLMGQVGGVFKGLKTRRSPAPVDPPPLPDDFDQPSTIPFPHDDDEEFPSRSAFRR